MVNAQGVWSEKQKKFLSTLSAHDDTTTTNTSKITTVVDEDDDPDEIDISELPPSEPKDDFMRQRELMMRQMMNQTPDSTSDAQDPFGILRQMQSMQTDSGSDQVPMNPFAMLQQMQASADSGGPGTASGDPFTMMTELLQNASGSFPTGTLPNSQQLPPSHQGIDDSRNRLWRIIHVASIILLLFLLDRPSFPTLSSTTINSSSTVFRSHGQPVFWWFITLELILQSTRLFLHGPTPQGSILAQVAQFLPAPYNARVSLLARYSSVFSTLRDDFWILLIGLGLVAWWRST